MCVPGSGLLGKHCQARSVHARTVPYWHNIDCDNVNYPARRGSDAVHLVEPSIYIFQGGVVEGPFTVYVARNFMGK